MRTLFEDDVINCINVLKGDGLILYPTDTIWGIGCDATNEKAIRKIYELKKRDDSKSVIILVAEEKDILKYVAAPDLTVFNFLESQRKPTTVIFSHGVNLPSLVLAEDGSVAIRLVQDEFCRHLIKRLGKPIVSTSANVSGQPSPSIFREVSTEIKNGVDYTVKWRQDELSYSTPSQIIKWYSNGRYDVIRS